MADRYDVVVVGGGPAGSMTALRLARAGARVLVLEEKRMPRGKVCGEFISPEAFPTLERAGVMNAVLDSGAQKLRRLVLCPLNGAPVESLISTFSGGEWALSLSRKRLDAILFDRAQAEGAECVERTVVRNVLPIDVHDAAVEALSLSTGKTTVYHAHIVVDASGRSSRLGYKSARGAYRRGRRLYAMKAHISGTRSFDDAVGLFFFPNGYGGISAIEAGLANVCFIAGDRLIRNLRGDGNAVLESTMMMNPCGRDWLSGTRVEGEWLTVGPLVFGPQRRAASGVLKVGDAAGMNDPFTGTGITIALRSGELAAAAILDEIGSAGSNGRVAGGVPRDRILSAYNKRYAAEFAKPMAAAAGLRRVVFSPTIANIVAAAFAKMPGMAGWMLEKTRVRAGNSGTFEE